MGLPGLRSYWVELVFGSFLLAAFAGLAALPRIRPKAIVHLETPASVPLFRLCLVLAGFFLGYARHAATFGGGGRAVTPSVPEDVAVYEPLGFYSLEAPTQKASAEEGSVRTYAISGLQHSLEPVYDENGVPVLDARGRWHFTHTVSRAECTVALPAEEKSVAIPVPFSRITSIRETTAAGPTNAMLPRILRHPNRVESFARPRSTDYQTRTPATLLGRIYNDPEVYNGSVEEGAAPRRTVLEVEPLYIQPAPGDPFFPIESGRIQVTLSGSNSATERAEAFGKMMDLVSRTDALGNDIVLKGALEIPQEALNPDGFDYRAFLQSRGIGAQMYVAAWQRSFGPALQVVIPEGRTEPRNGNPLVMASLHLRDRMLRVIKETLPFPQSAYVAGITLGMRHGLQNAECVLSDSETNTAQTGTRFLQRLMPSCQDFIADEFKRAGVNHVLAVSGLHVTIITALLVGIFSLFRMNRRYFVPIVLVALVVFSVITGARPSTLRAVIMNGLFLLLWAYLKESLKTSVLLAAAVAGFVILLQNPRLLTDPSFTLSFGAILSLGLLTGPFTSLLNRFRGNDLISLAIVLVGAHGLLLLGWFRVAAPRSMACCIFLAALVFGIGRVLDRFKIRPIGTFGFSNLPTSVSGFLAAQGAIQFGMMIPLSAYYFARWPVIGSVANLIAIPLIGVVLQLSLLACIVGLIPVVGPMIALVLNAANWVGCVLFMLVAHGASAGFPYPFTAKPSGVAVGVYYLVLAVLIILPKLKRRIRWTTGVSLGCALAALALVVAPRMTRSVRGTARVSVLSVGYGGAVLYRAAEGDPILFDAGYTHWDRSRISQAERTILPRLSSLSIRSLDALVILSDQPERLGGAALVLEQCRVGRLVLPSALAACFDPKTNELRQEAFDALYSPETKSVLLQETRRAILGAETHSATAPGLAAVLASRRPSWINRMLGIAIRIESAEEAKLKGVELLADTPKAFAAVLSAGDGTAQLLLAGDTEAENLLPWLTANPAIRAVSLPRHGLVEPDAEVLSLLAERGGFGILETGSIPGTLRRTITRATVKRRDTLAACEAVLPPSHIRTTDQDGAVEFLLY